MNLVNMTDFCIYTRVSKSANQENVIVCVVSRMLTRFSIMHLVNVPRDHVSLGKKLGSQENKTQSSEQDTHMSVLLSRKIIPCICLLFVPLVYFQ